MTTNKIKWSLGFLLSLMTLGAVHAQYTMYGPTSAQTGETKTYGISGSDISNISWATDNGATITNTTATTANYKFNNPGRTIVSCTVFDEFNNSYARKRAVTVCNTLNGGGISGAQTICTGGNPSVINSTSSASGGNGTYSYQWQYSINGSNWSNISGATAASYDPPSGIIASRWYRRQVNSCSQFKHSNTVKVTVPPNLSAGAIQHPVNTCYGGDPGVITVTTAPSGGDGNYSYAWQYSTTGTGSWVTINGAIGATYNPPAGATSSLWYRKKVISCSQTQYTSAVQVKVYLDLDPGTINGTDTICYGGNPSTLDNVSSASGGNNSTTQYQWQVSSTSATSGFSNISGAAGTTYDPPGGLTSDRWYRRRAISCSQTKYSNAVKISVWPNLSAGSITGTDTICYGGDPAIFGSSSNAGGGNGSYNYQWQYSANGTSGWTNISGATSSTYDPPSGLNMDSWYRRQVQSCSQTKYTSSVKVTTYPDLIAGSINGVQSICGGNDPAILGNASSAGGGNGSYSYQWQYSNNGGTGWTDISGAMATTYDPPSGLNADRWYRREAVSCGRTKYTSSIKVTVTAPPVWYVDVDGDGFGNASSTLASCTQPSGYVGNSSDYDDSTTMITNIAPQTFYADKDGDGFGESTPSILASFQPLGYADNTLDQCPNVPGSTNGCDYQSPVLSDENYIFSRTYQAPMPSPGDIKSNRDVLESINYFDGLGRPMQQIVIKGSINQLNNLSQNNVSGWTMDWTEGSSGTAFFNRNGQASENEIIYGPDPFGNNALIWACGNDPASNADGGWNTDYFNVDKTKTYRYMVWVRRDYSQDGKTYHGTRNVDNLGGGANSNPYFWAGDLPQLGEWYLLVGIVHPYGYAGGDSGVSGVYDMQGNKLLDGTEFTWSSTTTTSNFRSYLYYATDVNIRQYFYQPILEIVDGTEVPLADMFAGDGSTDLISHVSYDSFGRQDKQWLPYPETTGSLGNYRGDVSTATQQYYQNKFPDDFTGLAINQVNAFSEKELETSPLSRVLKLAAPGEAWQLGNGHEIEFAYSINDTNEVRRFSVTTNFSNNIYVPTLVDGSGNVYYGAGELFKNITKDENHDDTLSKLHTTEEFTDKQGRVVLKRTYADVDTNNDGNLEPEVSHDTYYVYDDYGNLTYVLPPKVDTSNGVSQAELDELGYQYKYDGKNRLVEKKIPGKGWESIVYDKMDQPIMTRDAILGGQGKWLFTRYDALGRLAFTGMVTGGSRQAEQTAADNASVQWSEQSGTPTTVDGLSLYYNTNGYPILGSVTELHTVNYYDGYNSTRDGISRPVGQVLGQDQATDVTGLPTATKVRVLDNAQWISTLTVYDKKGRAIWVQNQNPYLGITDIVKTELDFVGRPLQQQVEHTKDGNPTISTTDTFAYDHSGRLVLQEQTLGGQTETLFFNRYDDLGQLIAKKVGNNFTHPLQTVDYTYNIRGWLTDINDVDNKTNDLFAFQLHYNTPTHSSAEPLFNGNISQVNWSTANTDGSKYWYMHHYDALNRINESQFAGGGFWDRYSLENVSYDKNGNIQGLIRRGHTNADATTFGAMDNLVYSYDSGNKLLSVSDATTVGYGFKDGNTSGNDFAYDANGNLTMDLNKGIQANDITYNHLNLPTEIVTGLGTISYVYDAMGTKLEKSAGGSVTKYAGNYIYSGAPGSETLQFFSHPEGYITPDGQGAYDYVYQYNDHLGNVRLSYQDIDNDGSVDSSEILQERNYYPFGLEHRGYNGNIQGVENNHMTYQGQEHEEELGKETYAFQWRDYDPAIARFNKIDRFAEKYANLTPYHFAANNPMIYREIQGDSLQLIGNEDAINDVSDLIYRNLGGLYDVNINDDTGLVTLNRNSKNGQLNSEQQGFFDVLDEAISNQDTASFTLLEDGSVLSDQMIVGDNGESSISANSGEHRIDLTDILAFPTMGNGKLTEAGAFAHEIKEGFEIQINGTDPFIAHSRSALGAERQSTGTVILPPGASLSPSGNQLNVNVITRGANNQAVRSTVTINVRNNDITTITNNN